MHLRWQPSRLPPALPARLPLPSLQPGPLQPRLLSEYLRLRAPISAHSGPEGSDALPSVSAIDSGRRPCQSIFSSSVFPDNDDEQGLVSEYHGYKSDEASQLTAECYVSRVQEGLAAFSFLSAGS